MARTGRPPKARVERTDAPPGCRWLALTQGAYALIDESDYAAASKFNWQLATIGYAIGWIPDATGTRRRTLLHRWLIGEPTDEVDHINQNRLDCRRCNLRLATHAENAWNGTLRSTNTSGFRGVFWHPRLKKWRARITWQGRGIHIGVFTDITEAARAYDAKARELFGKFAALNFPEGR